MREMGRDASKKTVLLDWMREVITPLISEAGRMDRQRNKTGGIKQLLVLYEISSHLLKRHPHFFSL